MKNLSAMPQVFVLSLSEEDLEDEDILRPDDLCLFKININMGKKDKTVSLLGK